MTLNKQIVFWLQKCHKNISNFRSVHHNMTPEDKVHYIREQYYLLYLLNKVLDGKAKLSGVNTDFFKKKKQQ